MHHKVKVGVLRGGPSREYEVSLKSGEAILKSLSEKYEPIDIFISKDAIWHIDGKPVSPEKALRRIDVALNALHGEYGEDGQVQHLLEQFGMPFTGSRSFPSALSMNKALTKEFLKERFATHKLPFPFKTPVHTVLRKDEATPPRLREIWTSMLQPTILKPVALGSSIGIRKIETFKDLEDASNEAFEMTDSVIIEEFIKGKEATCGVVDHFRGKSVYALLPVEIVLPQNVQFFDYALKYDSCTKEVCPGNFSKEESAELQDLASLVHKTLGLRHYSCSDFIVTPKRGIYFLEANSLPGLTPASLFPKELAAIGCSFADFLDHIITLAREGK